MRSTRAEIKPQAQLPPNPGRRDFLKRALLTTGGLAFAGETSGKDLLSEIFDAGKGSEKTIERRRKANTYERLEEIQRELGAIADEEPTLRNGLQKSVAGIEEAKKTLERDEVLKEELEVREEVRAMTSRLSSVLAPAIIVAGALVVGLNAIISRLRAGKKPQGISHPGS